MERSAAGPVFHATGALVLFGHESQPAVLSLFERARGWRMRRAVLFALGGLVLAPVVVLAPPHVPWLLAALGGGGYMSWRSWNSRFAVVDVEGSCPRCDAPMEVRPGSRLRQPHPMHCSACHHELVLELDPGQLPTS